MTFFWDDEGSSKNDFKHISSLGAFIMCFLTRHGYYGSSLSSLFYNLDLPFIIACSIVNILPFKLTYCVDATMETIC